MGPWNLYDKKLDDRKETEFTDNQYLLSQKIIVPTRGGFS